MRLKTAVAFAALRALVHVETFVDEERGRFYVVAWVPTSALEEMARRLSAKGEQLWSGRSKKRAAWRWSW